MRTLDELLAPVTAAAFLADHVFQEPLVVRGTHDKFASLFSWDALNHHLSYSRHDAIRVHLDRVGARPDDLEFTHRARNVRGEDIPRIDVPALYRHLREGATLVVDSINEVDPAVAALVEGFGATFSTSAATAVLFASFGHTLGFIGHWDSRDGYSLQIEGEKRWRIFRPSVVAPLGRGDVTIPGCGEPGPLWWEGTVHRGDLVYVPRGWWHDVTSTDAPSLHLNLGFEPLTGLSFVTWLAKVLEREELLRRDVPRFADTPARDAYRRAVVDAITARLHDGCIDEFLAATRAAARPQTHVSLPLGTPHATPRPGDRVRLVSPLIDVFEDASGPVVRGVGRELPVPPQARAVIAHLRATPAATLAELATASGVALDEVTRWIATWIERGFVATA